MRTIVKVMSDKKGCILGVKVKTKTVVLKRPKDKLCLLLESENNWLSRFSAWQMCGQSTVHQVNVEYYSTL